MKSPRGKQRELVIVLGSLFVFSSLITLFNSFSVHILYEPAIDSQMSNANLGENMGNVSTHVAVEQLPPASEGILDLQTPQDTLAFIHDLLESRSIEKAVLLLKSVAPERLAKLLELIADKVNRAATNLTVFDVYQLFAGAAQKYKNDEAFIDKLVKILLNLKSFYQEPFLYIVGTHPEYHASIDAFVKSFKKAGIDINRLMADAEKRVASTKDAERLTLFLSNPLPFTPETKKQLTWQVIMAGAAKDIAVLKKNGFDLNMVYQGKTPLIQAVINGDEAMVRALLQAGVTVNTIANDAIGSALQQALITKNLPIELLLRDYGAHE